MIRTACARPSRLSLVRSRRGRSPVRPKTDGSGKMDSMNTIRPFISSTPADGTVAYGGDEKGTSPANIEAIAPEAFNITDASCKGQKGKPVLGVAKCTKLAADFAM